MSPTFLTRQARWHCAWIVLLVAVATWMLVDATLRRSAQRERAPHVQSIVRLLGLADLALSSSSRWLRHPSITEPGAAFADGPAILDNDPAGAVIGPPHDVLAGGRNGLPDPAPLRDGK
jgi:hypothetical protein